jgi:DNA (cytosine-5)-methyltransferase 1
MKYKELLLSIYDEPIKDNFYVSKIDFNLLKNIKIIAEKCFTQKGVYTVLITLSIYKILHPQQDIRNHQTQIKNGFSGRTIDTQYITPTLKELGLPSMAESGWLTRSLEQPYPYTLNYEGKIGNKEVKKAFLELIDAIEVQKINPQHILVELFKQIINIQKQNQVIIKPLNNPEKLTISKIIDILNKQFSFNYNIFGGSKLPVLAFYAIYQILVDEIARYNNCELKALGSHTASDKSSKSAGDIEIIKLENLFEVLEIKLDKQIDSNILRIAQEKIIKYNPERYYILSYLDIKKDEIDIINNIISQVKNDHGCQIVVNGVIPSLKYYLRLISSLGKFINIYSQLIENDLELKVIHKNKWNQLMEELENEL